MPLNVAITGATGFIGAAVVAELLAGGAHVTVLLRADSNCARLAAMKGFKVLTYSTLLSEETIHALSEQQPDIFIHCAWRGVGGNQRNKAFQISTDLYYYTKEYANSYNKQLVWLGATKAHRNE